MQTIFNEPGRVEFRLPQRILNEGWWLTAPLKQVDGGPDLSLQASMREISDGQKLNQEPPNMNRVHSQVSFSARLGVALLLTALADFFFFNQPVGLSLFLFSVLLVAAIAGTNPVLFGDRALFAKVGFAIMGLIPLLENISALSISIAFLCLSISALAMSGRLQSRLTLIDQQVFAFLVTAPLRLPQDFFRSRRASKRRGRAKTGLATLAVWAMPALLGFVFLYLFGIANPIIASWMSMISLRALIDLMDLWRVMFWVLILVGAWAFLRPRLPRFFRKSKLKPVEASPVRDASSPVTLDQIIFGRGAILRALVLFNLLFAAQTILDGAYLWGGLQLPDHLTYASYAHRGAYPLIVTALLAGAFVLITMQPGSRTSADRLIRALVYLWTAQTIGLVVSSILRLDLYVSIYSLTYWRIAAFIWMGLVAVGLALIIARIALGKSNEWLSGANLLTLSATLYACSFVNFAAMIAEYNIAHSQEMNGGGRNLDISYLRSLGPDIIPAIDRYVRETNTPDAWPAKELQHQRGLLVKQHEERMANWRAWTFREWRLSRDLIAPAVLLVRDSSGRFED